MSDIVAIITEVGFPVAAALGLGVFVWKLINRIIDGMEQKINTLDDKVQTSLDTMEERVSTKLDSQYGIIVSLIDRIRAMDNQSIRQDVLLKTLLGVPNLIDIEKIAKAERDMVHNAILDYMKKNPDVDSATDIAKAVTVGINRKISGAFVENSLERAGLNPNELFKNKAQKIFDDVKVLDKVIKSNQKLLKDPNVSFAEKNRQFVRLYANATGKSIAEASGEFITRLRKLGQLYTKQPQRFATELYNKIKTPLDYINSDFQKNFVGLTDAAGNLGVVDKAKLLGLPKSEIKLLSELSGAVSKLGAVKMAGDHTDIDSLMKNFPNYRKNYTS